MKNKGNRKKGFIKNQRPELELEPGLPFSISIDDAILNKENLSKWQTEMLEWIADQQSILENLLLKFDAFDIIGNLIMTEIAHNPETYKETEHSGLAAIVEHIALTYLKYQYSFCIQRPNEFSKAVLEVSERAKRILLATNHYHMVSLAASDNLDNSNLGSIRAKIIGNELYVRNPSYPHHHREQLEKIFAPYQSLLQDNIGFTVHDVLQIEKHINSIWNTNMKSMFQQKKSLQNDFLEMRKNAISGNTEALYQEPLIQNLKKLSIKDANNLLENIGKHWLMSNLGKSFLFTNEELAKASGISIDNITNITNFFSIGFQSQSKEFKLISTTHDLKTRPFIKHGNFFMQATPGTLIWAIQSRLETEIQQLSKSKIQLKNFWTSYQKNRAQYLEQETITLLAKTLKQAKTYQSLSYSITSENGKILNTELDGIVIYDTTLFLIEAKAGSFIPAAKRGAKDSIITVIKKLIAEAQSQALRAKDFITSKEESEFLINGKERLIIKKGDYSRIIPIVVTLESLDVFNATLHEVAGTGLLPNGELPWVVSLDILRVISEIVEFPSQLVHYLMNRLKLNEFKKFHAHDELDWFGLYLSKGLYYKNSDFENTDFVSVESQTDSFDAYYAYKTGMRKTFAAQPRQKMPHLFRKIILELDSLSDRGHSEAILSLLEWSGDTRKAFVEHFDSIRKRTIKDGEPHNFTFVSKSGAGLTCASTYSNDYPEQLKRLIYIITARKYEQKINHWMGFITLVDDNRLITGFIIDNFIWEYDEELEKLANDLQPIQPWPLKPLK